MAKALKAKLKACEFAVPQSRAQAVEYIAEIGRHQREVVRLEAEMNDRLAQIKEVYEAEARPHKLAMDGLTEGVRIWCEANRSQLTQGGKTKTVPLETGEVKWRVTPPKVVVRGIDTVLDQLRRLGLARFIRQKEEINKEAILNEPEAVANVKGIRIEQHEDFVVEPFEVELAKEA